MPIIGVLDSSKTGRLAPPTGFYSIASATGSSVSSVTFSAIPSYYKHLQLRIFGQSSASIQGIVTGRLTINGDTGNNYAYNYVGNNYVSTSSANSATVLSTASIPVVNMLGNSATVNAFATAMIDITDYSSSTKKKTLRVFTGNAIPSNNSAEGPKEVYYYNGFWNSTASISSLTLTMDSSTMKASSIIALYGWL